MSSHSKYADAEAVPEELRLTVFVKTILDSWKNEDSNTLDKVLDCERNGVVVKLKTKNLVDTHISCAILESPHEANTKSKYTELIMFDLNKSQRSADDAEDYIDDWHSLGSNGINKDAKKNAAGYLPDTKADHAPAG